MSEHVFDVVAVQEDGSDLRLGRTWLNKKDDKWNLGITLSSLPLNGESVQLVSEEPWDIGSCPKCFAIQVPIEKKDGGKPFWHALGKITACEAGGKRAFDLVFTSQPFTGKLVAFPAKA